ncbi:MAG TPA: MgtC/SapB family protein, partial [Planctomycetota bacterium]|nr:MgtC/SapB family protein [Planctomycetota bacterium]
SCALAMTAVSHNEQNPLPLLSAIITGVGFLGAGALFRSNERVVGFTSAATIWIFAVLGMTIGVGEYLIAGLVFGSIATVSLVDRWLETHWVGAHNRKLSVEVSLDITDSDLSELGLPPRASAQLVEFDREAGTLRLTYLVKRPPQEASSFVNRLAESKWVRRSSIET